jgi:hypothetical protein
VTPAQLEVAKGAVRCGSCLHIFDARENFVNRTVTADDASPPPVPAATAAAMNAIAPNATGEFKPPAEHSAFDDDLDDDFLISDDMDDEKEVVVFDDPLDMAELQASTDDKIDQWDQHSPFEVSNKAKAEDEELEEVDETWALNILDNLQDDEPAPADPNPPENLGARIDSQFDGRQTGSFDAIQDPADDYGQFDHFMDQIQADDPAESEPNSNFDLDNDEIIDDGGEGNYELDQLSEAELSGDMPDDLVTERDEKDDLLDAFEPEPLELTYESASRKKLLIKTAWITGNLALLFALILQIGYLKFDTWSRAEPYRAWYAAGCALLPCTLPTLNDFSKIKISLVVRTHPEQANILQADAILLNTAEFEQPFPPLALSFTDINNQPVNEIVFSPRQYLSGELAGRRTMPTGQPVQLNLQLDDPGVDAVNYRAYIPGN